MAPRPGGAVNVKLRALQRVTRKGVIVLGGLAVNGIAAGAQSARGSPPGATDSVTIRIVNTELRTAVQIMGQYLDRPVVYSGAAGPPVTLETPRPVRRIDVVRLLGGLLESQNYELVRDDSGGLFRARPKPPAPPSGMPAARNPGGSRPVPASAPELFLIPLKHARAADVAATINALYGRTSLENPGSGRVSTLGDELRANVVPPAGAPLPQSIPGTNGRSANLSGDLTLVPDTRANSLLIRANRGDFDLVHAVVEQLDVRPLQVLIEVLIAEVNRDQTYAIGIEAQLGETPLGRTGRTRLDGSTGSVGLGDWALHVMNLGGVQLDATIRLAAQRGNVRILSRPVVITSNNQPAEIVVGSQRPFVQVQRSLPTDLPSRDQIVQYKDVGTKLNVLPTISVDGSVQLEVTQEVSNATTETQFNAPVISTRSVKTELLVRDGQTVVLGGLSDRQRDVSTGGIPILSSIPLIGGLFGHHSRRSVETELFVFLTPHVIRSDDDAERVSAPLRARARRAEP